MLADPVASPMVKPIVTGFTVPARFAPFPSAANTYLLLPFGKISMVSLMPSMTPENVNPPAQFFLKEPAGMVIEKVPTFSCTGSVAGAIPSNPVPVPSETTECDEGIFVQVDYRLWSESRERFRSINNGYRHRLRKRPRREGEPLTGLKAPVVLPWCY
jgi:hypothetical protein